MINIKQALAIIHTFQNKNDVERRQFDQFRRWYNSEYWKNDEAKPQGAGDEIDDTSNLNMETNYAYAYVDTLAANICPTNPQVNITARRHQLKDNAKIREALVNEALYKAKSWEIVRKAVIQGSVYPRSWVKATWRKDRKRTQFLNIDPRVLWFDREASCFEDMRYIIHAVVLTKAEFDSRIKGNSDSGEYDPEVAEKVHARAFPDWLRERTQGLIIDDAKEAARQVFDWVVIYEFFDLTDAGQFFAIADGTDDPLLVAPLPYRTLRNPFYLLTFNDNLRDISGLSDVKLIAPQQKVLNELQTLKLWHALASIPIMLVQAGMIDNPEEFITALSSVTGPGELVMVKGRERINIRDIVEEAKQTIEMTLGLPRYARGEVGNVDIATEAALADTNYRTRNSPRQKKAYGLVEWMAMAVIGHYTEFLPIDSEIPVRLVDSGDMISVTRDSADLNLERAVKGEDVLDYDYETRAFNAPENNRIVMLKMIREHWDALVMGIQSGALDAQKLLRRLTDLMMLGDIMKDIVPAPAAFHPTNRAPEGDAAAGGELPVTELEPSTNGGPTPGPESPGGIGPNLGAGTSPVAAGTNQFPVG